ncbi:hypothetical protein CEXT_129431 [Caerostris extrusa]|uniref:DUF5679 domain-containing protein n=1 Tax=Caerostris extrusa TaxID=172846 RepID=A0AAV4S2N6_CAEEX|nr:hypothetical protein CEXT_129431 [Caerostris extrusa]
MGLSEMIYCVKCKPYTETKDINQTVSKNNRPMLKRNLCTMWMKKVSLFRNRTKIEKETLDRTYYDPETGYCGINELKKEDRDKTKKEIKDFCLLKMFIPDLNLL